jgi:alanine racemase
VSRLLGKRSRGLGGGSPTAGRPNVFEVDLSAIAHNVQEVRRLTGDEAMIFAAVKADAYGFGIEAVAEAVTQAGGDAFALVELSGALRIRLMGNTAPILLYGGSLPEPNFVSALERYDIMVTISDAESAQEYSRIAEREVSVFVEVDVGMERLGAYPDDSVALVKLIERLPRLKLRGVYTHLHVGAAERLADYFDWQLTHFDEVLRLLADEGIEVPIVMAASSPLLAFSGGPIFDAVDAGHLIYGFHPSVPPRVPIDLQPACTAVRSKLVQVKAVTRAEHTSDAPFSTREGMRIGIVPLGRGDGLGSFSCGEVLVRGQRCPIVGKLSLEHCRIDLEDCPAAGLGDEVVVIGSQGSSEISLEEVREARQLDEVGVVTAIRHSVPRRYFGAGSDRAPLAPPSTPPSRRRS